MVLRRGLGTWAEIWSFGTRQEEQKLSPGTGKEAWIAAGAWYNRWGGSYRAGSRCLVQEL